MLSEWASSIPCITHVFVFGSRAREDYEDGSDLDIAIILESMKGDADSFTTWLCESERWEKLLEEQLPYKVDLQYHNQDETPTIKEGLGKSSILVYSRV